MRQGGVFNFDSITFTEIESKYTNNSALYGGVIFCSKCKISTSGNYYKGNKANEGGVI